MDDDRTRTLQSEATRLADAARERAADTIEDVKVASSQIVDKVRDLIEEGNVRRISLRKGSRVLFEIPLTVGVGAGAAALLTSPLLAAVGAIAALVSDITVVVERDDEADTAPAGGAAAGAAAASGGDQKPEGDAPKAAAGTEHVANVNEPGKAEHGKAEHGDAGKTVGKPSGDA